MGLPTDMILGFGLGRFATAGAPPTEE